MSHDIAGRAEPVRIAVIGLGRMGLRHLNAAWELGHEVVGVADLRAEALEAVGPGPDGSSPERFLDPLAMLETTRPDCVVVATTAPSHCEYTCRAAERGARFVLCEKPMASSLAECDRMIAACAASGVRLAVNHPMRFVPMYVEAKGIVDSPEFGGLTSFALAGGNMGLAMNGTHYVELFRFLTGEAPAAVTAWLSPEVVPNPRGAEYEDRAGALRVTTPSGKRMYLDVGADQGHGSTAVYSGPFGQMTIDEINGTIALDVRQPAYRDLASTRYASPADRRSWTVAGSEPFAPTRAVLEALIGGGDPPSGEDGRLAVAVLVAAHLSAEQGSRPVSIAGDELPSGRSFPWA